MNFIDIHCHILPAIDDGAEDLHTAVEMCRQAAADGIRTIVATPHFSQMYRPERSEIEDDLRLLNHALTAAGIDIQIIAGAELAPREGLPQTISERPDLTIAGRNEYILLEPPPDRLPDWFDTLIFDLRLTGLGVILTHPERVAQVQDDPNLIVPLVQSGVMMQITAASLAGSFGGDAAKCAMALLKMDAVHFIATDAHSSCDRTPHLSAAYEIAAKVQGSDAVRLVRDNPQAAIAGGYIEIPQPQRRRSFFSLFR